MDNFVREKLLEWNLLDKLKDKFDDEGKVIKASYGKKFLRSKLCDLIIKNELKGDFNKRITSDRFRALAIEINDIFLHEPPELYYVSYVRNANGKPKAARGKLWSTYCYLRKTYKQLNLISQPSTSTSKLNTEVEEDCEEHIQWLKNNSLPFPIVIEKWKATTNYRIAQFPESIDHYLNTYKCLRSQTGFLLLENINDLEPELSLRASKYANYKLTSQPIPVIIGESLSNIEGCYVCFNDIRYRVDTPLKAVDLCFKVYHTLNAEYPKECDSVWMFIQTYIYEIKTEYDRKYVATSSLMADIEKLKSEKID
ncbi:unnamed protein product [Brassicogethes aeneus]|uniref:Uncharacterized protein n=1 Tax=Brassicogethes aeneus TaxID=1431903 RepID=A0A9P0AUC3_BRAAE|nr:unnamed protein product [Brassicogethes aeneus]